MNSQPSMILSFLCLALLMVSIFAQAEKSTSLLRAANEDARIQPFSARSLTSATHHRRRHKKCRGPCSSDRDCIHGLHCLQYFEHQYNDHFPGCSYKPPHGKNWCYDPKDLPHNRLFFIGNEGYPRKVFPLDKCRGDCDNDSDCKGNLKCFDRSYEKYVPGCKGYAAADGTDYCYDPADDHKSPPSPPPPPKHNPPKHKDGDLVFVGNPPRKEPLYKCEGDCDTDHDCYGDLKCYQRVAHKHGYSIPGCKGKAYGDYDYCYDPYDDEKLLLKKFIFGECEGDCDYDSDCKGHLKCFKYDKYKDDHYVPGCKGHPKDGTDYCYNPSRY